MLQRVLHQLLRGHVDHVVVVVEDGVELGIDALLHDLRRVLAVDAVHLAVDEVAQVAGGVLDLGREQVLGQQLDLLHLVGDGAGIRDDELVGRLLAEIRKLLQHLVRGAEIDRAVAVGVGEFLRRLQDLAVLLVLGVEEVHVARGDDGLAELPAERQDRAVVFLQHLLILHAPVFDEKAVVADGLDLQVIVVGGDLLELLLARAGHDRAVELAHAAGGADEDALPVLIEQALRHRGIAVEVFEVGLRDHLVEIFQPPAVFHQQDHVVALRDVRAF